MSILLLKGDIVVNALWLDNASVMLLLPCALILAWWGKSRWNPGAVVLSVTILIKPVFLPLLAIPPIFRRWKALMVAIAVAAVGMLLSLVVSGNLREMFTVAKKLEGGSDLIRKGSVYNLSILGVQHDHQMNAALPSLLRLAVVAVAVLVVVQCVRRAIDVSLVSVGALSGLLLGTVFLAGPLSEIHYLFLLIPGAMIMASGNSRIARYLLLGSLVVAGYSAYYFGGVAGSTQAMQLRCVVIEFLVFAASVLVLLASPSTPPDSPDVRSVERTSELSTV